MKSRRVPLRLVLMYDNMHRVQNQEILKLSPDSKLVIDEHGKATLRVRIEEVSKNHQKQVLVLLGTERCSGGRARVEVAVLGKIVKKVHIIDSLIVSWT